MTNTLVALNYLESMFVDALIDQSRWDGHNLRRKSTGSLGLTRSPLTLCRDFILLPTPNIITLRDVLECL